MTPATTTIEPPDQLDPWGFGVTAADRSVLIEGPEPLDEPVDDFELLELTGLASETAGRPAAPAVTKAPAPVALPLPQKPAARGDGALVRLPFPADRLGLMALFGAVIVAQAFYIGFSLTGEASARPAGVSPRPPVVAAVPVAHLERPTAPVVPPPATGALGTDSGPERVVTRAAGEPVVQVADAPTPRAAVPTRPTVGWLHITAPFDVQVFEEGQLVSATPGERLTLPAGGHVLELVNAQLGVRQTMKAVVLAGKVSSVALDIPEAPVAINAQPWAEVVVDGRVLGETPLANLMLPIGAHQIVLRHPELGERIETVTVRATGANRVSADLRR